MKNILIAVLFLFICAVGAANQKNTVLDEKVFLGSTELTVPRVDGLNEAVIQNKINALLEREMKQLSKESAGNKVTYKVILNRPSLLSFLLQTEGGAKRYKAVNLDLTTGQPAALKDFFTNGDDEKYADILLGDEGIFLGNGRGAAYDNFVPYEDIMENIRIGEAGRLLRVERLTEQAAGKTLRMSKPGLLAIKLPANTGSGYRWFVKTNSSGITTVGNSFTIPHTGSNAPGVHGTEIIFMAAKQPGLHVVTMEYKRSWERSVIDSLSFTVEVQ